MKYFTGIGSRYITEEDKQSISDACGVVASYFPCAVLISGGAIGSDQAWEDVWKALGGEVHIMLPKEDFYDYDPEDENVYLITREDVEAHESVERFHANHLKLSSDGFKYMRRNYRQILHPDGGQSSLVLTVADCNEDGTTMGGTGQAVRIANRVHSPVINMRIDDALAKIERILTLHKVLGA